MFKRHGNNFKRVLWIVWKILKVNIKAKLFKGFYPLFLLKLAKLKFEFWAEIFTELNSIRCGIYPIGFTQFGLKMKKLW